MREFVGRQFAEQDRAGLVKPRDRGRVLGRDIIGADPRVAGGADAGGAIDVLQPERYPVQRPAIAARHDLALGDARLLERLLRGRQQECIELRIQRLDTRNQRLGQFDRRQKAALDLAGGVGDRQPMQIRRRRDHIVGHARRSRWSCAGPA